MTPNHHSIIQGEKRGREKAKRGREEGRKRGERKGGGKGGGERKGREGGKEGVCKGELSFSVGGKEALDILEFCAPQVRSIGYSGILGASGKKHRIFWDFGQVHFIQ